MSRHLRLPVCQQQSLVVVSLRYVNWRHHISVTRRTGLIRSSCGLDSPLDGPRSCTAQPTHSRASALFVVRRLHSTAAAAANRRRQPGCGCAEMWTSVRCQAAIPLTQPPRLQWFLVGILVTESPAILGFTRRNFAICIWSRCCPARFHYQYQSIVDNAAVRVN